MTGAVSLGRAYFAVQAIAGFSWWAAVFVSPAVRVATLGNLDPVAVAAFDISLFVMASAAAALGVGVAAVISTVWTGVVALALAVYATTTTEAGLGVLSMGAATGGSLIALCLVLLGHVPTAWIIRGPFAFRPASKRPTGATHLASTFGQIVLFWGFFLAVIPMAVAVLEQRWAVTLPFPAFAAPVGVADSSKVNSTLYMQPPSGTWASGFRLPAPPPRLTGSGPHGPDAPTVVPLWL